MKTSGIQVLPIPIVLAGCYNGGRFLDDDHVGVSSEVLLMLRICWSDLTVAGADRQRKDSRVESENVGSLLEESEWVNHCG